MKRKRRELCPSPLIDDSPKRTKVHAQRKFAQGSNANSPAITPVKEFERLERSTIDLTPEPVELLPIRRPNTEDFLTFLCFRGTPLLPPNLNFFNTASIVDTNGQVHEIKSDSPKNGPIDTSAISKSNSGQSDRPFIAFGVRKRADPVVISKQMDRKRRHALALQALRRQYQEQKMAKIRAVTISKLSEKPSNKTIIRSNSATKIEKPQPEIKPPIQKKIKVISTKLNVTSSVRNLNTKVKPRMCLRSFRGRFVQQELPFRAVKTHKVSEKSTKKSMKEEVCNIESKTTVTKIKRKQKNIEPQTVRVTRSRKIPLTSKLKDKQRMKRRILIASTSTLIKSRVLRSQTLNSLNQSRFGRRCTDRNGPSVILEKLPKFYKKIVNQSNKKTVLGPKIKNLAKKGEKKSVNIKKTDSKTDDEKNDIQNITVKLDKLKETKKDSKSTQKNNIKKDVEKITSTDKKNGDKLEVKKELLKKVTTKKNKSEMVKTESKNIKEKKDSDIEILEQKSQRPSRKTKEAAAIYMEILSHKLVNKKIDDDNISIDSFPELPSVKRTEQRENELKAKANIKSKKSAKELVTDLSKDLSEKKIKSEKNDSHPIKIKEETKIQENKLKENENSKEKEDKNSKQKKPEDVKKIKEEIKIEIVKEEKPDNKAKNNLETNKKKVKVANQIIEKENIIHSEQKDDKTNLSKKNSSDSNECSAKIPKSKEPKKDQSEKTTKNKSCVKNPKLLSDSDDECLANLSRNQQKKKSVTTRQTRNNALKSKTVESDSEDSFHIDVKISRKKPSTRSKSKLSGTSSKVISNNFSDFDENSYASASIKNEENINTTKKISTKKSNKTLNNFSDSDEEPLSKFTSNKKEADKSAEELKEDILRKQKALIESPQVKTRRKISKYKEIEGKNDSIDSNELLINTKPKRECAKRPSNYLPMFSSSDDEDKFFLGFSSKNEKKKEIYQHSSLDFLSKDLDRRFGKEKVNMSNEQIQKWLKDSAMAGNDIKKDDEMKYCEEIPTETTLDMHTVIDTENLKNTLLENEAIDKMERTPENKATCNEDLSKSTQQKSPADRKPIFKKEKSKMPAVGAFSVNNESSIYAFEDENYDVLSTPFRRPSRRPSSTATSKSEDELKSEEQKLSQFRKPILKNDEMKSKTKEESTTKPTGPISQKLPQKSISNRNLGKALKRTNSDQWDDNKYKIPSSPSASSSSSANLYKKQNKQKLKLIETCNPIKVTDFPCNGQGELVEAPTFYPTEKEFQDPLEYIEKISLTAEQFGVCRIVPPNNFKPDCKVSDDMRFTSYNQYVHKMLHRWGPNFKELMAIKKYLQTQNINLKQPPWIGGMEVDLPRLYQTVQNLGGLKEVIEKEKWSKVSDMMRIPKSAQDRVTKLDDIYCKYLLPYDTLSPDEREKLLDEVETEWAKRESKTLSKMQKPLDLESENDSDSESDNEVEECITKGRNMALNAFYRIARNTMSTWFKNSEPSANEIEKEFWKHVVLREKHICVHSGSIDSGSWGYGFAVSKNSPFARHAWNLKVLTNNSGSVLRSLGPVMGVTVPTLHVGMVFSACCWYRDPHSLPWIEYLHTGGNKIWYGIPNSVSDLFQKTLTKLVPNYCKNQGIWLPSDTVMLPPNLLMESGVSLSRIVQEPGQFIVVFPKAFTSSISTGYVVSESVFFAPPSWLKTAQITFDLLRDSCEPSMFSLEKLYLSIVNDQRTSVDVLKQMTPIVISIYEVEKRKREKIKSLGVKNIEMLPPPEAPNAKRKKKSQEDCDYECEICRMTLFISLIIDQEDVVYCLDHAIEQIEKKNLPAENCKLLYTYSEKNLENLVDKINLSIEQKIQKKVFNKFSGMPTLLNK